MKIESNIVGYNTHDILLLCSNLNEMVYHFIYEIQNITEIERLELISIFEDTYVAGLIEQINNEEKKKPKKSNKIQETNNKEENNSGKE